MEQRTPEWYAARCGKVTASRIADVMAKTKTGYGAGRANYMAELVAERLTGRVQEGYTNAAMQHGIDTEEAAVEAYNFYREVETHRIGFVDHPKIKMAGASPDGLVEDDSQPKWRQGLVEIKCPNTATHIDTLLNQSQSIPLKYIYQMQWQMACTRRKWCDFVSYDPRLPEHLKLWVHRVKRDDLLLKTIEEEVQTFLAELNRMTDALERLAA